MSSTQDKVMEGLQDEIDFVRFKKMNYERMLVGIEELMEALHFNLMMCDSSIQDIENKIRELRVYGNLSGKTEVRATEGASEPGESDRRPFENDSSSPGSSVEAHAAKAGV